MKQNVIQIRKVSHRGQMVWMMSFPYEKALIQKMKSIKARYSRTYTSWYLPCNDYSPAKISRKINAFAKPHFLNKSDQSNLSQHTSIKKLKKDHEICIIKFQTTLQAKGYSSSTVKTYTNLVIKFLKTQDSKSFSKEDIEHYIVHHLQKMNYANSTQRQFVSALKLYCEMLGINQPEITNLNYPKKKKPLPQVLSTHEIKALLDHTTNLKHKTIVSMLYSTGMRRGELLNLKVTDINRHKNTIHIKYGKGGKDRIIPLGHSLKELLQKYYEQYRPSVYLFEGMVGEPYSASSVAQILIKNGIKARIPVRVTPHQLRHSFATHLLESGVSLRHIQVLLGHHSSRTTEIYTKVTTGSLQKIPNPLDTLS